jgi:hypothetical protein
VSSVIAALSARWGDTLLLRNFLPQVLSTADSKKVFGIDMSIESLRSQQYSYYIFGFLVVSLVIFCVIIVLYLPKQQARLKRGERIMFGAIILGVMIALIFGYLQLIEGFLV